MPQLAHQKLPADDVKQTGHRHQQHAQRNACDVQRGGAKQRQQQREADIHHQPDQKGRQRDRQTRPHARRNFTPDAAPVVRVTEVEHEHGGGLLPEYCVGDFVRSAGRAIQQQRFVVTALLLPLLDGLRRHALDAKLHARHVVRRVHHEKQRKGEQVHPDQDRHGIEDAADQVGDHGSSTPALICATRLTISS